MSSQPCEDLSLLWQRAGQQRCPAVSKTSQTSIQQAAVPRSGASHCETCSCKIHQHLSFRYMIIHNKVYNLKSLMGSHPGGDDILLSRAGTDATKDFEVFEHSEKAVGWVRSPGRLRSRRNMHSCKLHLSSRVSFPLCRHCHWLSGPRAGS